MSEPDVEIPQSTSVTRTYEVTDNYLKRRSQELGIMGKVFGSKEHAPINIAGTIIVLGVLGLILIPFFPASPSLSQGDLAKTLGGLGSRDKVLRTT